MNTMTMTKRAAVVALAVALMLGLVLGPVHTPRAEAQGASGYPVDRVATFKGSIASAAAINTAISGARIRVKKIISACTSSASFITFTDGASGSTKLNLYLAANTARDNIDLGGGILLTAETALYAVADSGSGTASFVILYNVE